MGLKHKVRINVTRADGSKDNVLTSGRTSIRNRFLSKLLGDKIGILVLTPGCSVQAIEVMEINEKGGTPNE